MEVKEKERANQSIREQYIKNCVTEKRKINESIE